MARSVAARAEIENSRPVPVGATVVSKSAETWLKLRVIRPRVSKDWTGARPLWLTRRRMTPSPARPTIRAAKH